MLCALHPLNAFIGIVSRNFLWHSISLIHFSRLGILAPDELSDVIVFMVLIACDPSSPPELERRITNNLQEIYDDNVEADTVGGP